MKAIRLSLILAFGMFCLGFIAELITLHAQDHTCTMAQVDWVDAVTYSRQTPTEDFAAMLGKSTSIGCVEIQKDAVLIITMFQQGKPAEYVVLPAPWVVKITKLQDAPDDKELPRLLPNDAPPKAPLVRRNLLILWHAERRR